jgi:hypothetical protein
MSYNIQERRTASAVKGKFSFPFLKGKIDVEGDFTKTLTDSTGGAAGIAKRLCELCNAHGVSLSQLPRIVPEIRYPDVKNTDALLESLTPQVVDSIAKTFGISSDWLDGTSESIYQTLWCYKAPENLFHFIKENQKTLSEPFPLRLLSTKNAFDRERSSHELALVAVHEKEITPDFSFQWYTIFEDSWIWSHPPARLHLKALARTLWFSKNISIPIITTKLRTIEAVREGKLVPHAALNAPRKREHLEDYALTAKESLIALETDEVENVITLVKTYVDFL